MSGYEHNKAWRLRNPSKRNAGKKRNYAQTVGAANTGREWTSRELEQITALGRPLDRELSVELGRSVQAIQVARAKVNRGQYVIDRATIEATAQREAASDRTTERVSP